MMELIMQISLGILALSTFMFVIRVIKGPSIPDRIIALDAIGINLIGITAIVSILLRTTAFFEIILLLGILAFIGTVAFSKFLEKGEVIENDRHR
ncbi:Na(+)/H(+) antiporter subunit F1 [Bacillus sp. NPDC077027]|uniref:Na(+)/H(+) antiporter subunit F1 n=1 Tax=Bacillus sp. NPDC077027 TaxID=3390548 RepID=UPI003CFFFD33